MSAQKKLENAGIDISCGQPLKDFKLHEPIALSKPLIAPMSALTSPLVSCLMITRGNVSILKYSVFCYARQTYNNRELVVIVDSHLVETIQNFLFSVQIFDAMVVGSESAATLGDRRNMAAARAQGEILMTWDDDDLFDPFRIEFSVSILLKSGAAATFLARLFIWWPHRNIASISNRYLWEGSMAIWRKYIRVYPAISRGEDTALTEFLIEDHPIAEMEAPQMYVYTVTGQNACDVDHFQRMIHASDCIFEGSAYLELIELLSHRLPILEYQTQLQNMATKN